MHRCSDVKVVGPKLKRAVGLFTLTMYGIGIILGAGVYAIIGKASGEAGNAVWLSFLVASLVSMFTGLSYMELMSMFQRSAAEYTYVKHSLGSRLGAFVVGWIEIVADVVAASTVAIGFAGYFVGLFGGPLVIVAIALIAVLSLVNFWGIVESTKLNVGFSLIEVAGLLIVIATAIPRLGTVNLIDTPRGITGVLSASALIFFAFIGFEDIANIAEETREPEKTAPRALLFSVIATTALYVLVGISVVSLVSPEQLATSTAPLALAISGALGSSAFTLMSAIALFATANTVLVLLIVGSRMIYGMSSDGSLPKLLSRIHAGRRTPWAAVSFVMVCAMLFVLLENIEVVAGIADFSTFAVYSFVNVSLIILRYKEPRRERLFRVPLNIGRFPAIPFFGLLSIFLLAANLAPFTILLGLIILLAAVPSYHALGKLWKRET
jgi:APA family basic amino acid/polyamine antiporter